LLIATRRPPNAIDHSASCSAPGLG
jgi:hypothetical protein